MRGGLRNGAGRPRGSRNKRTEGAMAELEASGVTTPLAYMLKVMNDESAEPARRDKMALASAPYVHSKLTGVAWVPTKANFDLSMDDDEGRDFALDYVKQLTNGGAT